MHGFERPHDVTVGFDVGKLAHRACAVTAGGQVLFNVGLGNDEASVDRVLADALGRGRSVLVVVDQRRNIGTLVLRRARAAGHDVAYMPGIC
ncbi:IS110 family transposase [Olsenella porci]|uniref:IS110 family transposase n=1 Tax=Olsenella porci TaxID=2652279 RepID=A0A6N7XE69_9ACTN|nr:transposase [Olsenella porci]MST72613.1 IS110 family transposase [Olsenella porci]